MLIHINDDSLKLFKPTQVDATRKRFYYASADPRAIIRCDGFPLIDVGAGEYLDASVGWDEGGHSAYVLAGNENKRHTKITFHKLLGKHPSFSVDDKLQPLSAILATAPRERVKFDELKIAQEVVGQLREHIYRLGMRVYPGGISPTDESDFCPVREEIKDLCRIANGEAERKTASPEFVADTHQLIQDIAELCAGWWGAEYDIPRSWRETELGRAWDAVRYWLLSDDMLTLSAAARLLFGAADANELNKVDRAIKRGDLDEHTDPTEPNSQRARRVLNIQVKAILKKRGGR